MRLRQAHPRDAGPLADLNLRVWRRIYPGIVPQSFLDRLTVEPFRNFWIDHLNGDGFALLAEPEGEEEGPGPAGFIACATPSPPVEGYGWEIRRVYVDVERQGQGLGRRLMAAAAAQMMERGGGACLLWVFEPNERARGFYRALGGVELRRQCFWDFDGQPMWEIAYGWPDLSALARADRPAPASGPD